ncbi:hypothetical protein O6H91_Y333900 [Diphasiastrum complanatum]|nr:hypothetical protein O6H91_Y333900 [Diphasiastrum complanatum]
MEDRALLCRNCDVSIHTINTISSNHQRFLVTGARVALSALGTPGSPRPAAGALLCPASRKANAMMHTKVLCTQPLSESAHPMTNEKLNARENSDTIISNSGGQSRFGNVSRKSSISEFLTETVPAGE